MGRPGSTAQPGSRGAYLLLTVLLLTPAALAAAPAVDLPPVPDLPSVPPPPTLPGLPTLPDVPAVPSLPSIPPPPTLPGVPALPDVPPLPAPGVPQVPDVPVPTGPGLGVDCSPLKVPAVPLFSQPPKQKVVDAECAELNATLHLVSVLGPGALAAMGGVVHDGYIEIPLAQLGNLAQVVIDHAQASVGDQQAAGNFLIDDVPPNGTASAAIQPPAWTNQRAMSVAYTWEDCFIGLDYGTLDAVADAAFPVTNQHAFVESKLCTTDPDRISSALLVVVPPSGNALILDESRTQGDFSFVLPSGAPDGVYGFYPLLTDVAGNVEPAPTSGPRVNGTFVDSVAQLDTTPPVVTATVQDAQAASGWYLAPTVHAALACADAGSGCKSITYTLDGVSSTVDAPTASVSISPDSAQHSLTYFGADDAGNVEPLQTLLLRQDSEPPASGVALSGTVGDNGWFTAPVTATLSCTDATSGCAGVAATLDGSTFDATRAVVVSADGMHGLAFHATDKAGNVEAPDNTAAIDIDSLPPVTTATIGGILQAGFYRGNATVRLACADATSGCASTSYEVDDGAVGTGTTVVLAADGGHTVRYWSTDVAGNVERVSSATFQVDAAPPRTTVTLTGPAGLAGWFTGPVNASLACADDASGSGCASTVARLDGEVVATNPVPIAADGQHALAVHSADAAGNVEPDVRQAVDIDSVPPGTEATIQGTAGHAGWYTSTARVALRCSDATSGCAGTEAALDGGALAAASAVGDIADGAHVVTFRGTDVAGNAGANQTRTVSVDTKPPITSFTVSSGTPGNAPWYVTLPTITFSCDDAGIGSGCSGLPSVSVDGDAAAPVASVELPEGLHTVASSSADVAGNVEAASSRTFHVDATPPTTTVTLTGPSGAHGWFTGPVRASFACADATSGCDQVPADRTIAAEGTTTLTFHSTDVAGNAEADQSRELRIDSVAPAVSITSVRDGQTVPAAFTLRFDTEKNATVQCFDGSAEQPCGGGAWALQYAADGNHTLTVQATDDAGNTGAASVRVHVSTEKPSVGLKLGAPVTSGGWAAAPQQVTVTLLPIASQPSLCVAWDDASLLADAASCQAANTVQVAAPEGAHVLYASGTGDGQDYPQASLPVRTDGTPPAATFQLTPDQPDTTGWFRQAVSAHLACSDAGSGVDACQVRGGPAGGADLVLGDGAWVLTTNVTDQVGHAAGVLTRAVQVDTKPPEVTIDAPALSQDPVVTVRWDARDVVSGLASVRLERVGAAGGAQLLSSDAAGTLSLALDPDESVALQLTATDRSGQEATLSKTVARAPAGAVVVATANGTMAVGGSGAASSVRIAPESGSVRSGERLLFTAAALDGQGHRTSDRVRFSVADASVGIITPDGAFTGLRAGATQVVASAAGWNASAAVTVTPGNAAQLLVAPAGAVLPPGGGVDFLARGRDAMGNDVGPLPVVWQVQGPGTIDASGHYTAGAAGTAVVTASSGSLRQQVPVVVTAAEAKAGVATDVPTAVVTGTAGAGTATGYVAGVASGDADALLRLAPAGGAGRALPLQEAQLTLDQPVRDFAVALTVQSGDAAMPSEVDAGGLRAALDRLGTGASTGMFLDVQASENGHALGSERLNQVLGRLDVKFRVDASYFEANGLDPAQARLLEFSGGKLERDDIPARLLAAAPVGGQYEFGARLEHFSSFAIAWTPRAAVSLLVSPEPPCTIARGPISGAAGGTATVPLYDVSPRLAALVLDLKAPLDAASIRVRVGDGDSACRGASLPALPEAYVPLVHLDTDLAGNAPAVAAGSLAFQLRDAELGGLTALDVQTLQLSGGAWKVLDTTSRTSGDLTRFSARLPVPEGSFVVALQRPVGLERHEVGCAPGDARILGPGPSAVLSDARPALVAEFAKTCAIAGITLDGVALSEADFQLRPAGGVEARPATPLAEGAHEARLQLVDGGAPLVWSFTLDLTPPVLGAPEPANGSRVADAAAALRIPVRDALSGVDAGAVRMTLDGAAVAVGLKDGVLSYRPEKALAPGSHTVRVDAGDLAGNVAHAQWSFQVQGKTPFPGVALVLAAALGLALALRRRKP